MLGIWKAVISWVQWKSVITIVASYVGSTIILKLVLPSLMQSTVKSWFDRKLEDHKHELSQLLEGTKFNFARLMNDYSTFNQKRHETYAELYRLLLIAEGCLGRYGMKLIERINYSEYNETEIRAILEEMKIPQKAIERISLMWETDQKSAHEEIYDWQERIKLIEARNAVREFHNQYLSRELYLSHVVDEKLGGVDMVIQQCEVLAKIYVNDFVRYKHDNPDSFEILKDIEHKLAVINEQKYNLKSLMVKELQQGTEGIQPPGIE